MYILILKIMSVNAFTNEKKLFKCFCNNCTNKGNIYKSCNMPITSVGIIAYYYDTFEHCNKFIIIKRRDTLGYVDFLRGKYNVLNTMHIQNLINEMTVNEKKRLQSTDFDVLWKELWDNEQEKIDKTSKYKFETLKNSFQTNNNLSYLINNSNTSWNEPEWGFPKGRRNHNEKDYSAAIREFNEETGIPLDRINIFQNIKPFEECFIGSNFKAYKHKYFLAKIIVKDNESINDIINFHEFQRSEVSELKLCSYIDCLKLFRSYNKERCILLYNIEKLLHKYK